MTRPRTDPETRFWAKVDKDGPVSSDPLSLTQTNCWVWTASDNGEGYGQFWNGKSLVTAHGFIFHLQTGERSGGGREIDHLCRNRRCVRPDHLEMVDRTLNAARGLAPGFSGLTTHCNSGHLLSGDNLKINSQGRRVCKTCAYRRSSAYYAIQRDNKPTRQEREYLRKVIINMAFEPSGIRASSIVGRVVAPAEDKFDGKFTELRIAIGHGYKKDDVWTETGTTWLTYTASGDWAEPLRAFNKGDLIKITDAAIETKTYKKRDDTEGLQVTARFGSVELLESKRELADAEASW